MINNFKVFIFVLVLFVLSFPLFADMQDALIQANESFTYKGEPIHPKLVKEFNSWISDPGLPTTISVDIAAPHRNEYFDDYASVNEYGAVTFRNEERGYFCYRWLGKLDNGIHVLNTSDSGGVFLHVL